MFHLSIHTLNEFRLPRNISEQEHFSTLWRFYYYYSNYIQKSQPKDKLANEELMPYVTTLMYQEQGPWPIRISVLLENIIMEATHKRTVERSLKQCEEILKLVTTSDSVSNFHRYVFVQAEHD